MIIFLYGLAVVTLGALAVQQMQEWLTSGRAWTRTGGGATHTVGHRGRYSSCWRCLRRPVRSRACGCRSFGDAIRPDRLLANEGFIQRGFWIAAGLAISVAVADVGTRRAGRAVGRGRSC
jgi:hypothetical protein